MKLMILVFSLVIYSGAFLSSFSEPISIVFLIDNSGSMCGQTNTSPNDQWGTRFRVVSNLLDSILAVEPASEIGLAIFSEHLFLDITSPEYFAQYFHPLSQVYDNNPDQAYLPFMQLNEKYSGPQQNNLSGLEVIKDILQTDTIQSSPPTYIGLRYSPKFSCLGNTNINIAFIAAKKIFSNAKNPADRQSIVFLSDGEPQGTEQAGLEKKWFQSPQGVLDLPATFTVFFSPNDLAPASLQTMTAGIRTNGYSSSNPLSNLWAIKANYNTLVALLTQNVLGHMVSVSPNMHNYTALAEDLSQLKLYDILGRQLTLHSRQGSGIDIKQGIIKMSNCPGIYISKSPGNANSIAHKILLTQ